MRLPIRLNKNRIPIRLTKYRNYLTGAETYQEAVEMAPDDADVQEGDKGGFFYEVNPSQGQDDEDDGGDESDEGVLGGGGDLEYDGYELEEFGDYISIELTDNDVSEGDKLFVNHPDGDYIAEVDDIEFGEGGYWRVEFGGGTFHLDPDTVSQPVGLVTDEPELGGQEEVNHSGSVSVGDTIAWADDAGYTHFGEVDSIDGNAIQVDDEEMQPADVTGVVESTDPTQHYDIPSPDDIEGTSQPEEAAEFNENLAKAVADGDPTTLPAYAYQQFAGSIQDEELAIDCYEGLMANEPTKTARERMEMLLRGMGYDPEEIRGSEIDPDQVPSERKGTVFSGFESQRAINVAAAAAHTSEFKNWEVWNDFFDHLTETELEKALEKAAGQSPQITSEVKRHNDPLDYEGKDMEFDEGDTPNDIGDIAGAIMSRLPEGSIDTVESVAEDASLEVEKQLNNFAASYLKSTEDRKYFYEEKGVNHRWANVQFDESLSPDERLKKIGQIHTGTTGQHDAYGLRASLWGYSGTDDEKVNGYNNKRPIDHVEPAENVVEAIEHGQDMLEYKMTEEPDALPKHMQQRLNDDGTVTVRRGVSSTVTGHSPVESWSTNDSTPQQFDGAGILEVDAEPSDILVVHGIHHNKHATESEVTLIGGNIVGDATVVDGDPIEFKLFKIDTDGVGLAPNHSWVEAAIYDDMFDPGMGPRMRAAREGSDDDGDEKDASHQLAEEIAQRATEKLSSGSAGVGSATYGGARDTTEPHPDEEDEEDDEKSLNKAAWERLEKKRLNNLEKSEGYAKIDDELMKYYSHIVWWGLDEQEKGELDLSKSPDMWESSENVPDFVKEYIKRAFKKGSFWQGTFENLPMGAEQYLRDTFEEKMTQPQGWSLGSIIDDLKEKYPNVDKDYLLTVTRNEVAAVANEAREQAYKDAEEEGEEFKFYWSGPEDFRTTDLCSELKTGTHPNHGGEPVSMEELQDKLLSLSREYDYGTPDRVDNFLPHWQCRHTFTRKVYL